jgi:hypothetical protein
LEGFGHLFPSGWSLTVWKVGNGKKVRIGEDPWLGAGDAFHLSESLVWSLHETGIYSLVDAKAQYP